MPETSKTAPLPPADTILFTHAPLTRTYHPAQPAAAQASRPIASVGHLSLFPVARADWYKMDDIAPHDDIKDEPNPQALTDRLWLRAWRQHRDEKRTANLSHSGYYPLACEESDEFEGGEGLSKIEKRLSGRVRELHKPPKRVSFSEVTQYFESKERHHAQSPLLEATRYQPE